MNVRYWGGGGSTLPKSPSVGPYSRGLNEPHVEASDCSGIGLLTTQRSLVIFWL